jgi:GDSL-like protein
MYKYLLSFLLLLTTLSATARKVVRVACVGNSITYGTGIANRELDAYPSQLQRMLGKDYLVGNFGKPGATLLRHGHRPYFQQTEFRDALQFKGDIAVIHLGINDTDPRNWPNFRDEFVGDYVALMDSLRQANPKVRIILSRLTPIRYDHPRFDSGTELWRREISETIDRIAASQGVELIDFYQPLIVHPDWLGDGIHPGPRGAKALAETVYKGITGNYGGLQLSPLFSDGMVLQRGGCYVQGLANAGANVVVSYNGRELGKAVANNRGEWRIWAALSQPVESGTLTIAAGREVKRFKDVAVGEVWLCSGQSNMAFKVKQAETAQQTIAQCNDKGLRLYNMSPRWETDNVSWDSTALAEVDQLRLFEAHPWKVASPESVGDFSAVAYYMGKMLRDSLKVPVGIVCNAVGGTPTEAWIDRPVLEEHFSQIFRNWRGNDFVMDWVRGRAAKNVALRPEARHPYHPAYCYEAGMRPLEGYTFKGVAWYQGESNAHNATTYARLLRLLEESWTQRFTQTAQATERVVVGLDSLTPQLRLQQLAFAKKHPFYLVQLSSIERPSWPWFRETQRSLAQELHLPLIVTSDKGLRRDVHPPYKAEVGERLGRAVLRNDYGFAQSPLSPEVTSALRAGSSVWLTLATPIRLITSDQHPMRTFEVAGADERFYPAVAEVTPAGQLVLSAEAVKLPRYVRYGWQPFSEGNVVSSQGLPLSTFRMEVK